MLTDRKDKYEKKAEKSFIHAHQIECHDGAPAEFATKVTMKC